MAIVNKLSTELTNIAAGTMNLPYFADAVKHSKVASIELAGTESAESILKFFRVPSNARIDLLAYANDALTTGTMDIGVFAATDGTTSSSDAVDADEFASAVSIASANAFTDCTYEAIATDISKVESRLWERLGLTADPNVMYDICGTLKTIGTTAGTVAMKCEYVV